MLLVMTKNVASRLYCLSWFFFSVIFILPLYFLKTLFLWLVLRRDYIHPEQAIHVGFDCYRKRNGILSILLFKEPLSREETMVYLKKKLLKFKAFTHKIVTGPWTYPYFEKAKNFDLEDHLFVHELKIGSHVELHEVISEIGSKPFDFSIPLFSVHLLNGYGNEKSSSVIVVRLNHALLDGFHGMKFFFYMTEKKAKGCFEENWMKPTKNKRILKLDSLSTKFKVFWLGVLKAYVFQPPDSLKCTFTHKGPYRKNEPTYFAITEEAFDLNKIKVATKKFGVTVNDLFTSVLCSAFRKYLLTFGNAHDKEMIAKKKSFHKAIIWVNLGEQSFPDMLQECCNVESCFEMTEEDFTVRIGCIGHELPIEVADDYERLMQLNNNLRLLKYSPQAKITEWFSFWWGMWPGAFTNYIYNVVFSIPSISISNVPGPQHARVFAGKEIDGVIHGSMPLSRIAEMVHIMSYNSKVLFSVNGCLDVKKSEFLMKMIHEAVDAHLLLAETMSEEDLKKRKNE